MHKFWNIAISVVLSSSLTTLPSTDAKDIRIPEKSIYIDLHENKQNITYVKAAFGSPGQEMRLWVDLLQD